MCASATKISGHPPSRFETFNPLFDLNMKNIREKIAHVIKRDVPFALLTPRMVFTYSINATIMQTIFSFHDGLGPIMARYDLMRAALQKDRELVGSYDRY